MDAVGGGTAYAAAAEVDTEAQTCLYCANLKVLRDLLPPKRCDYCRKWRCQFCTLKFPLLGVRKGLPKVLKGNSRICIQCFGQIWQESEGSSSPDTPLRLRGNLHRTMHAVLPDNKQHRGRESRGVSFGGSSSMIESRRRGSMVESELTTGSSRRSSTMRNSMMSSSRRGSMPESERRESMMVDQVWAGEDSFSDSRRLSFMDFSDDNELAKTPITSSMRGGSGGLSYRVASFLGLVANDGSDGTSMNAAIGLWTSLFAASILLVIALADGFSLHQRLCYCVATYGIFLTLHPWIHADRQSRSTSTNTSETKRTPSPPPVAPHTATPMKRRPRQTSVTPERDSIPMEYKTRIQEMNETLEYYLSDESPWKLVKATRGSEIYELTENKTPFPIFKIEVVITGISKDKFMAFLNSKDPKDRSVWDFNEANFEVIETFDSNDLDDSSDVSVCVNTQKPFLGGLVAPRDFCVLCVSKENSIVFGSVDHPDVPARPGTTRGHLYFSCFHCKEDTNAETPERFALTYICQTDIGGNLPVKLLYNGTMDTMAKMVKVFQQAKSLFAR